MRIAQRCAPLKEKANAQAKSAKAHIASIPTLNDINANYSMWYEMNTKDSFVHTKISGDFRLRNT